MSIYTRNGDEGNTSLISESIVSKSDDRIELIGTIDELSSYIGFAKVLIRNTERFNDNYGRGSRCRKSELFH